MSDSNDALRWGTAKRGRGGKGRPWSDEETAYLREHYGTSTATQIAAALDRAPNAVIVRAGLLGLKSHHRTGINSLVPGYFKVIDTPIKAYLLGLLTADGYVTKKRQLGLCLRDYDQSAVELLRDELAPEARIGAYLTREGNEMARFLISSPELAADLASHGVVNAKTLVTTWPDALPYELENSYICGYFDGDGCLMPNWLYRWTIVSGTPGFLTTMQARIKAHTGIGVGGLYQDRRHNHAYSICQTGEPVRALDAWIHRDVPGLARKRMSPLVQGQDHDVLF